MLVLSRKRAYQAGLCRVKESTAEQSGARVYRLEAPRETQRRHVNEADGGR